LVVLVALIVYPFRGILNKIMLASQISQKSSFKKILCTSFFGVYSHVFLDSFLYGKMAPFYPLEVNLFFNLPPSYDSYLVAYGFCSVTALLGIALYSYGIARHAKT